MTTFTDSVPTVDDIWNVALTELRDAMNQPSYNTWLQNIAPVSLDNGTLTIAAPNEFIRDWLERRYSTLIADCATRLSDHTVGVSFVVSSRPRSGQPSVAPTVAPLPTKASTPNTKQFGSLALSSAYTFDRFVVGRSNQLAEAAAQSVSNSLAEKYNPLFIYGDVGLGKTHLMQAIGHNVRRDRPETSVVYVSGETFLYHVVSSIREDRTDEFRRAYRNVDLWLVDDIQYMLQGQRTQIEFFHVFNSLYQTNKQIVICSDRAPKDLDLEDRLRSRFEWGLITEIGLPDFEHRVAILERKAESEGVRVPQEVLNLIAERITTSIRALEGALTHLMAQSSLTGRPVDLSLARVSVDAYSTDRGAPRLTIPNIQKCVADFYSVTLEEMKSQKRNKTIMLPRQIAMYLSRTLTEASLPDIGRAFGGRDHSTVIHSCEKIKALVDTSEDLRAELAKLRSSLGVSDAPKAS